MRTIWKFPLVPTQYQEIRMPKGARLLCVHTQGDKAYVWAEVETNNELEKRAFEIVATGREMEECMYMTYIGSFFQSNAALVFHLYERR